MSHAAEQLLVLAVFLGLFGAVYHFEHHIQKHKQNTSHRMLALLAALCCHPVTIETMKNFAVHIVFFSGYVLRLH